MASSSSSKKMTMKSSDGESFEVEDATALESQPIKHLDVSGKLSELTLRSSDGESFEAEALKSPPHDEAPLPNVASSSSSGKKKTLRSSEGGESFVVEETFAEGSDWQQISQLVDDYYAVADMPYSDEVSRMSGLSSNFKPLTVMDLEREASKKNEAVALESQPIVEDNLSRKIKLKSSEGESFKVEDAVVLESQPIKHGKLSELSLRSSDGESFEAGALKLPPHKIALPKVASSSSLGKMKTLRSSDGGKSFVVEETVSEGSDWQRISQLVEDYYAVTDMPYSDDVNRMSGLCSHFDPVDLEREASKKKEAVVLESEDNLRRKITLKSSEGELFKVEEAVAFESDTIKHLADQVDLTGDVIPLPNVSSKILAKVIDYCKKHVDHHKLVDFDLEVCEQLLIWDADFIKVDQATLYGLLNASTYLNISSLQDLSCLAAGEILSGKTKDEINKIFNVVNDFTPEEEDEVRKDETGDWAFKD